MGLITPLLCEAADSRDAVWWVRERRRRLTQGTGADTGCQSKHVAHLQAGRFEGKTVAQTTVQAIELHICKKKYIYLFTYMHVWYEAAVKVRS